METAIAKSENEIVELEGVKITRGEIELIKRTIFIGANDDELRLFFYECRRRGVHPMDRLIYPVSRKDKDGNRHVTFQMGIDYLRAAAEETGRYVGQEPVQYGPQVKQATDDGEITVPEWAEATVKRKDPETGEVVPVSSKLFWKEYYPGQKLGHMWRKMPYNQLGKCAEASALRKAFPRKLGGLYINEEMEQAEAVPFTPIQMPKEKGAPPEKKAPANPDAPASDAQLGAIATLLTKLGVKDDYQRHDKVAGILDFDNVPETLKVLTMGQASKVIETLQKEVPKNA